MASEVTALVAAMARAHIPKRSGLSHFYCATILLNMPRQTFRIEWDALEYEHKERSQDWFWAMGIVTVSIAVVSAIFGNIIFSILVLLAAFSLSLFINRPPEEVHVVLDERGITKEKVHYPYEVLESFWIDEDHPHLKILVRSKKLLMPLIIVPLPNGADLDRLHKVLLQHLREERHVLPWVERLLEYLGF